jgi:MFS transporter, YNFM family, putative membrane transport protein
MAGVRSESGAVAALHFATVTVYADLYVTQPILPLLSKEFRIAPATAGLSVSVVVLMIALVSSPYGSLSDRIGRKPVMVTSCLLLAVPTLLCFFSTSFRMLVILRACQGLFMPGVTAVAVAHLGDHFTGEELGPRVGGWIAASVVGGLTGRVLSGVIAAAWNWRAPFLVFGVCTLAGAAAIGRALPAGRGRAVARGGPEGGLAGHLVNRRLVGAFLIGGSVFFAFIGVFTYLPYYLTAPPFRLSTALVSSVYLVYVAGVFTSILSGRLSRRIGGQAVMATGFGIAIAGVLGSLVPLLAAIVLSLVILCVGMFTVQSTAPAFVNANARGGKGAAGALYVSFYYVGASLGSYLPGYAWQVWGWPGVAAACCAALILGLAADLVLCR